MTTPTQCFPKVLGRYEYGGFEIVIVDCDPGKNTGSTTFVCNYPNVKGAFKTKLPRVVQVKGGATIPCDKGGISPDLTEKDAIKEMDKAIRKKEEEDKKVEESKIEEDKESDEN
jgi:hypothetical protein